jgi:hypothetical protein
MAFALTNPLQCLAAPARRAPAPARGGRGRAAAPVRASAAAEDAPAASSAEAPAPAALVYFTNASGVRVKATAEEVRGRAAHKMPNARGPPPAAALRSRSRRAAA